MISKELFERLLKAKDDYDEQMDEKVECLEEIDKDDVYNGMMLLLNIMIDEQPELQDIVNDYYN